MIATVNTTAPAFFLLPLLAALVLTAAVCVLVGRWDENRTTTRKDQS